MIRKPWPIIIVSFIFFFIPIFNILGTYMFLKDQYAFSDYIYSLFFDSINYFPLFNMVVPSLVAGVAVYCVKKWSYPVFLLCMVWIAIQVFFKFSYALRGFEFFLTVILPMLINILYVSYILLPKVRAPYYDPRLRWWETKPRYVFSTDLKITYNNEAVEGKMTNVSEGGLFAIIPTMIEPNSMIDVGFDVLGNHVDLKAKIVYRKPDGTSYGLQFASLSGDQKKSIKKIIAKLDEGKYEMTRPVPKWDEDFVRWFKTLITTGKGFVPEVQTYTPPQKKD